MGDLVPRPEIKPGPPALGAWSLSHWTRREVPRPHLLPPTPVATNSTWQSLSTPLMSAESFPPHLLNPEDLLDSGLGVEGDVWRRGRNFCVGVEGCCLNTRWSCSVAGEFYFLPWSRPWSYLPIICLPILHPQRSPSPTPCKYLPSITDLLFWNSASSPPDHWDPHPLLWTHHPFRRVRTLFQSTWQWTSWALWGSPQPVNQSQNLVKPTSQETCRRTWADSSWKTVKPSTIKVVSSRKPVSVHQGYFPHSVPWCKCDPKRESLVSGVGRFVTNVTYVISLIYQLC